MKINRRSYKLSDFFSLRLNDFQDRAREVLWFTLIAIPIPLMMQLDKYMYYFFGVRNSLASYSVYMFFFSGVVSIVSVANTVAISERLQQVNGKSNILDVRVLGGLGAISFVFLVPSVFRLAFPHLHPIPYISFLLGLYIFTISIFYNANLAILDIQHLKIRTLQYWLQFVAWLALTSIFIKILGIYDAVICGIVSSVLSYLKIRRISGRLK